MVNYRFNGHIPESNVVDVLNNEFDLMWQFNYQNQKHWKVLPIESADDDGEVDYYYNSDYFRCDDFTGSHGKRNILFGGCSNTEGVGSPLDTVWTKLMHKELSKKEDIGGFYSISKSGFGWQKIITAFQTYVLKYGFPTHFFVLLPNIGRFFEWKEDANAWHYVQRYPGKVDLGDLEKRELKPTQLQEMPITLKEQREKFIDFVITWKLFEQYCKTNNVKLIWSTWDAHDHHDLEMVKTFESFFKIDHNKFQEFVLNVRPDGKLNKHDLLRRDGHNGILWHEYWAKLFLEESTQRGFFND
jgi:hypothetical protein